MKSKLTPEIAEFIGMHIGDGTLYKTKNSFVWEMRVDLKEKNYYDFFVVPLLSKLFNYEFKAKFRSGGKNGCYGVQTCNKDLIHTLVSMGIKPGKKNNIQVPKKFMNSSQKIKSAFLRGYFDTDGCIRFDKPNKSIVAYYPRIEFCTISKNLCFDVKKLLLDLGLKS
ncbi:LAGLIDADG family homing endonuclease, partial [Bacteroidota bacterium]